MSLGKQVPYKILGKWKGGINNVKNPLDLSEAELADAIDVDLDNEGQASRKKGKTLLLAGKYRWGWSDGTTCLAWRDGNLVLIAPDFQSDSVLLAGLSDHRIVYKKVLDRIYFTNSQVIGFVRNNVAHTLPAPAEPFKEVLQPGTMLEYFGARLWVIRGNQAWPSDALAVNQRDSRMAPKSFPGEITLFKAVKDGIFVGHAANEPGITGKIYFMEMGDVENPATTGLKPLAHYNAIPHCVISVEGGLVTIGKTIKGNVFFFGTDRGICLGADGGEFANYTIQRFVFPKGKEGAAFFRENHKGTPQVIMSVNS